MVKKKTEEQAVVKRKGGKRFLLLILLVIMVVCGGGYFASVKVRGMQLAKHDCRAELIAMQHAAIEPTPERLELLDRLLKPFTPVPVNEHYSSMPIDIYANKLMQEVLASGDYGNLRPAGTGKVWVELIDQPDKQHRMTMEQKAARTEHARRFIQSWEEEFGLEVAFADMRKLGGVPIGFIDAPTAEGPDSSLINHFRTMAEYLHSSSVMALADSDADSVIENIETQLVIARSVEAHSQMITSLTATACRGHALCGVEMLLKNPKDLSQDQLTTLQELFGREDWANQVFKERWLAYGRASALWQLQRAYVNDDFSFRRFWGTNYPAMHDALNDYWDGLEVEILTKPTLERQEIFGYGSYGLPVWARTNKGASWFIHAELTVIQGIEQSEFWKTGLAIVIALERHKADHGAYPDSLQSLAPQYMAQIPVDPITTQSYKYTLMSEEERLELPGALSSSPYLLYGVGIDQQDNGGMPPKKELADRMIIAYSNALGRGADYLFNYVGVENDPRPEGE